MKKNFINLYIIIIFLIFFINKNIVYAKQKVLSTNVTIKSEIESNEELEKELIFRFLNPYIDKSIENYYGEPRQYDYWDAKILNIKKSIYNSDNLEITVSVTTFKGAHNPPYGVETITMLISDSEVSILHFTHKNKIKELLN